MPEHRLVAVIVLHWNNYADTHDCLESLGAVTYSDLLLVLVDNASSNDSADRLQAEFPECHFIINPANYGFAKGNNQGIRYALEQGADYVLLLNNDTVVTPDFLEPMVHTAETADCVGAVSGTIYDYDRETGPTNRVFYAGGQLSKWRGAGTVDRFQQLNEQPEHAVREVTYVTGCSMLIPRDILRTVGLLDERFFFGVEDTDYCWQLTRKRYRMYYVPNSIIFHKGSGSRSFTPDEIYHGYVSKCLLMKKHLPPLLWTSWYSLYALRTLLFSRRIVAKITDRSSFRPEYAQQMQRAIHQAVKAVSQGDFHSPLQPRE